MPSIRQMQKDISTKKMIDAARCEFAYKGFSKTRTADIALAAGVSNGLPSQRFGTKEDIYFAVFNDLVLKYLSFDVTNLSFRDLSGLLTVKAEGILGDAPEDFLFFFNFFNNPDIPSVCVEKLKKEFNLSRLYSVYKNAIDGREIISGEPWDVFIIHMKTLFGIIKSYHDAGIGTPDKQAVYNIVNLSKEKTELMTDISASFVSDFNVVFLVDLDTDNVEIYRTFGKRSAWFMRNAMKGYEAFRTAFSEKYLLEDDREWYLKETSKDNLKQRLDDSTTFYINHKILKADGTTRYYQSKFIRYNKGPAFSNKILIGGHEINEVIREREKDSKVKNEMSSVIAGLSDDYDGIAYVKIGKEKLDDTATVFRINDCFAYEIPGWDEEENFHNRLELMKDYIVHPNDRERFYTATRREYLIENLKEGASYFVDFRVILSGRVKNYSMKFVGNFEKGEIIGLTVGLKDSDNETIYKKEADKFREIAEVLSRKYTAIYYCDLQSGGFEVYYQDQNILKSEEENSVDNLCANHPDYMDALKTYVTKLVHPDDRENIMKIMVGLPERMKTQKAVTSVFRRNYFGTYLYTEMNCVRVSENENEPLRVVMGFAEMDAEYRSQMENNRQLELAVIDRTKELQKRNETLNRINDDIVDLLGFITEARDVDSGEHIKRVKGYTRILAEQVMTDWPEYGISKDQVEFIASASALHDIGKIRIPDSILMKPGKLSPEEYEIMKTHCEKGCEILKLAPKDWSATYLKISMDICRYHHEKVDGNGYPYGLKGDTIPISAQITSVADCFDALSTPRVYKEAYSPEESFEMILRGECGAFSEHIISSLLKCKDKYFDLAARGENVIQSSIPTGVSDNYLSWTKILLVDDSELGREVERDILEGEGITVVTADNGMDAVRIFNESELGEYDAILMDIIMPGVNGIDAAGYIRQLDRIDADSVPIIALASLKSDSDVQKCIEAGMNAFLTKPVSVSSLTKALAETMQARKPVVNEILMRTRDEDMQILNRAIHESPVLGEHPEDYDFICYINGAKNEIPSYKAKPAIENILNTISTHFPSNRRLDQLFKKLVPKQEFDKFIKETNRYDIISQLKEKPVYQMFFRSNAFETSTFFRLVIVPDPKYPDCYVLGLRNTDSATYDEIRSHELIEKLAAIYVSVLVINLNDDTFVRYSQKEAPAREYDDCIKFTELFNEYINNDVREDCREALSEFMSIDNIRENLSKQSRITTRFVDTRFSEEKYYEIEMINLGSSENPDHVLAMSLDITDSVLKEMNEKSILEETQRRLSIIEKKANNDALTGVKNITAYTDMVAELSQEISKNRQTEFGMVVCDINNLKIVNDTYGHDIGDLYIKNCCNIICDIFKRSPVYRIGGDEFVVILRGVDFENREKRMKEIEETVDTARKLSGVINGKASFAAGLSVYMDGEDRSVADVFKRADMNMYYRKNQMEK